MGFVLNRLVILRAVDHCPASSKPQAAASGQKYQGLHQEHEEANGRARGHLDLDVDPQAEQQQHRGLEG